MKSRWVVKAGSNVIVSGGPLVLRSWMQQVASLRRDHGIEVIWVTSGAIASARARTGRDKRAREALSVKQALSAVGQPLVMDLYNLALGSVGLLGAQVLLTASDLDDRGRRANLTATLDQLLEWGAVPVLNENDAVATEEIRFGDNDRLSALIARACGADRLVILTDVDGLYDSDPRANPAARLIHALPSVKPSLLKSVSQAAGSRSGTGGMYSKLLAAHEAGRGRGGVETWLVRGDQPAILSRVARDERVGTRIGGPRG